MNFYFQSLLNTHTVEKLCIYNINGIKLVNVESRLKCRWGSTEELRKIVFDLLFFSLICQLRKKKSNTVLEKFYFIDVGQLLGQRLFGTAPSVFLATESKNVLRDAIPFEFPLAPKRCSYFLWITIPMVTDIRVPDLFYDRGAKWYLPCAICLGEKKVSNTPGHVESHSISCNTFFYFYYFFALSLRTR